jgi:hypothetical protein
MHKDRPEVHQVDRKTIAVMEGDQTGQELLEESPRVLDPGVTASTTEFTDEVIRHIRNKLEIWSALA